MRYWSYAALSSSACMAAALCASEAVAQDVSSQEPQGAEDRTQSASTIIVTARRRSESIIDVPVAITAFTGEQLDKSGSDSLEAISQLTPQLLIGGDGRQSSGSIVLRGVSTGVDNASSDQAVSINVDEVQISKSNVIRAAQQDLAQVEILKGPQALFFGKNSPGGIIALKTADPTDELFVQARLAYELNANELYGRAIVSGPLTESLGARLMVYGSEMDGFFTNVAPGVTNPTVPGTTEYGGRLTLKFEPSDRIRSSFKATYSDLEAAGPFSSGVQRINCRATTGLNVSVIDGQECAADDTLAIGEPGAVAEGLDPTFRDGVPYFELQTLLLKLGVEADVTDTLRLSSVTGYFDMNQDLFDNFGASIPAILLAGSNLDFRQFSQELRLASDFDGAINFMVGGIVEDSRYSERIPVNFFIPLGVPTYVVDGKALSAFGQVTFDLTKQLELSAGLRYTDEEKTLRGDASGIPIPFAPADLQFDNLSPEVTLSWQPSGDWNIYGSYRQGFKSGGFNTTATIFAEVFGGLTDVSFAEETVEGFEIGAKAILLDDSLRLNFAAYNFDYNDLQLSTFVPGAALSQLVTNAGRARTRGVEFDAKYSPQSLEGLSLYGAIAYNEARYREFTTTCYSGQTVAEGCIGGFQDLTGRPLVNAPDLAASAGFDFESDISDGWSLGLSGSANYTGDYQTILTEEPASLQQSFWLLNGTIRLTSTKSGLEIALIGRNLTNQRYLQTSIADPLQSPEIIGSVNRGREISLQVTFTPSELFGR